MSYKIIDRTNYVSDEAPFFENADNKNSFTLGVKTWTESASVVSSAPSGIRALVHNDEVIMESDNRVYASLLSNDLNLLFNLDRTVYVSKKGTENGMNMDEASGVPLINHFDSITDAVDYLLNLGGTTLAPAMTVGPSGNTTTVNLWSDNTAPITNYATIIIGPGDYTGETFFASIANHASFGASICPKIHFLGAGMPKITIGTSTLSIPYSNTTNAKMIFENLVLIPTSHNAIVFDFACKFKNVELSDTYAGNPNSIFDLTVAEYRGFLLQGDIQLNDGKFSFGGNNSADSVVGACAGFVVTTVSGFGFWKAISTSNFAEVSFFGTTTTTPNTY